MFVQADRQRLNERRAAPRLERFISDDFDEAAVMTIDGARRITWP